MSHEILPVPPAPSSPVRTPTPDPDTNDSPSLAIPRPTSQRSTNSYPSSYGGGIPATAHTGETYNLRIVFRSRTGDPLYTFGPVTVVADDTDTVTIETNNFVALNVAPLGEDPIILNPHQRITLNRSILDR